MAAPISPTVASKLASKLQEALCRASSSRSEPPDEETIQQASEVAADIERVLAKTYGTSTKDYSAKGRSLCFNLSKNADLRRSVLRGHFPAEALVSASAKELATSQQKVQREAARERFLAMRSLGASSERIVGWQAGTSGKLEWSHKYEQQPGKPGEQAAVAMGTEPFVDDGGLDAVLDNAELDTTADEAMAEEDTEEENQLPFREDDGEAGDAAELWGESEAHGSAEDDATLQGDPTTQAQPLATGAQSSAANGTGWAFPGVQQARSCDAGLLAHHVSAGSLSEVVVGFKQRAELASLLPSESAQALGIRVEAALQRVRALRAALPTL